MAQIVVIETKVVVGAQALVKTVVLVACTVVAARISLGSECAGGPVEAIAVVVLQAIIAEAGTAQIVSIAAQIVSIATLVRPSVVIVVVSKAAKVVVVVQTVVTTEAAFLVS